MELLEEHTRRLAAGLTVDIRGGDRRTHVRALADDMRILRAAYRALAEDARAGEPPSPAAEWLLDNLNSCFNESGPPLAVAQVRGVRARVSKRSRTTRCSMLAAGSRGRYALQRFSWPSSAI